MNSNTKVRTLRFSKSSSFGSKEIAANFEDDDAVIGSDDIKMMIRLPMSDE